MTFSLLGLAVLYFFSAFYEVETEKANGLDAFFRKIAGFAAAMVVIGKLFGIMSWPGYDISLAAGGIILIITAFYMIKRINKNPENPYYSSRWIARLIILIIAGGFFYFANDDMLSIFRFQF